MPGVSTTMTGASPGRGESAARRLGQLVGVVVDRMDVEVAEQVGEHPLGDLAVLEHVGDPRRHAQVVLEHVHGAVRVADEVAAADVGPHSLGRVGPLALRAGSSPTKTAPRPGTRHRRRPWRRRRGRR